MHNPDSVQVEIGLTLSFVFKVVGYFLIRRKRLKINFVKPSINYNFYVDNEPLASLTLDENYKKALFEALTKYKESIKKEK